jgi:hydroxymethylglutaryl-CoA synthase
MINIKKFSNVGIVGFAAYMPYWRIRLGEIAQNWGRKKEQLASLGMERKAIASLDEDCLTMAVEASQMAIKRAGISPKKIGAVFVGSESHPYAVKPTGTILADILDVGHDYFCADLQFACKAATTGVQIISSMIESGLIDYGLVVGSDKAQAEPGDALEYTAAAGAAALILGKREKAGAEIISTFSFNSDTPDFWRRQASEFPVHTGRFTGEPGYFYHLESCLQSFLKRIKKSPKDFDQVIFHMPNAKFPQGVSKKLGFERRQLAFGFLAPQIGNPYSASSLLGLIAVLEKIKPNKNILLASYGSGAGSDAFWLRTRKLPTNRQEKLKKQKNTEAINDFLHNFKEVDYITYLKNYGVI